MEPAARARGSRPIPLLALRAPIRQCRGGDFSACIDLAVAPTESGRISRCGSMIRIRARVFPPQPNETRTCDYTPSEDSWWPRPHFHSHYQSRQRRLRQVTGTCRARFASAWVSVGEPVITLLLCWGRSLATAGARITRCDCRMRPSLRTRAMDIAATVAAISAKHRG
jgi:hypothetical protein